MDPVTESNRISYPHHLGAKTIIKGNRQWHSRVGMSDMGLTVLGMTGATELGSQGLESTAVRVRR